MYFILSYCIISSGSDSCVAYDTISEPVQLGHSDFQQYKVVFADMLVYSHQLNLEPRSIGEGRAMLSIIIIVSIFLLI